MRRREWTAAGLLWLGLGLACGGDGTGPEGESARITSLQPVPGSSGAAALAVARVEYGVAVGQQQPAGALVLLHGPDTVAGTLVRSAAQVLEFRPEDILDLGATYQVRVTGVRDAAGGLLPDTAWTFTTAGRLPGTVDGGRLYADASALAADSMAGRRAGTNDELRAATYLRAQLQAAGLSPAAGGQWTQGFTFGTVTSQNVAGVLPGAGSLASEWVVIGAHYDHLGTGANGVYNGADDNASGTAAMLELARVLTAHVASGGFGAQPRRSVLFIGFGAEEIGLVGSNAFCAQPLVPLASIAGMLNLDMIGRLRGGTLSAHGVSSAAEWPGLLSRYGGDLTINVGGLVGTDYRCFLSAGRPALALFTGLHEDYHQPTDDAQLLNVAGMVDVGNLALALAANLMLRRPMTTGAS